MPRREPTPDEKVMVGQRVRITASDWPANVGYVGIAAWLASGYTGEDGGPHAGAHHWLVGSRFALDVVPAPEHEGCPSGPDCTTCPDFTCRALNEKRSEMVYDNVPRLSPEQAEQRLIDQMTPRGKRALALERAKGIYPDAPVAEVLTVADWLLVEPDAVKVEAEPAPPAAAAVETPVLGEGPQEVSWRDSQKTDAEVVSKDYLDVDDEVAYFVVNGTSAYVTASRAKQVIAVLQRAVAMAERNA